jgi:predicted O-methyltransferase YrrM
MSYPSFNQPQETSRKDWTRGDSYFDSFLLPGDSILESTIKRCDEEGLPDFAVTPAQGKLLHLLLRSIGAKRVLELGTLGGSVSLYPNLPALRLS